MRRTALPLLVLLASCANGSSTSGSGTPAPAASSTAPRPVTTTRLALPTQQPPSIDPCKLTAAEVSAVVGFSVARKPTNYAGQCEYLHQPGGHVWFSVDSAPELNLTRAKADETFSLGGRYVTITDEPGFPHEAFTAVKNPGDKSPGVIADFFGWLAPGQLKLRIYYPSGGRPPGRQHALTLARRMLA